MPACRGEFTSVDPLMASAHGASPQTWNRYSYALNNPLRYSDPSGLGPGTTQDIARGKAVGNPHTSEEEIHRQYVLQAEAARAEQNTQGYEPVPDPNGLRVTSAYIDPLGLAGSVSRNAVTFQLQSNDQAASVFSEDERSTSFQVTLNLKLPKDTIELTPTAIDVRKGIETDNKGRQHIVDTETHGGSQVLIKDATHPNLNGDHGRFGTVKFSPIDHDTRSATATFTLNSHFYREGGSNSVVVQILGRRESGRIDSTIRITIRPPVKSNP